MGHFSVPELCCDVWIPQEPLEDEHRQTQHVTVALQGDELPEDCLRMSRTRGRDHKEVTEMYEKTNRGNADFRIPRARSVTTVDCMKEAN